MADTAPTPSKADYTAGALTLIVAALAALGVVLVYSSSAVGIGMRIQDPTFFLRRQLLWVFLAAGTFVLTRTTPMGFWRKCAWPVLGGVVTLLLFVLVAGVERKTGGARRWLAVGGFQGQPSELAKLGMVMFISAFAAGRRELIQTLPGAATALGCVALVAGLIAVEPDMGTALLITTVCTSILVVAGLKLRHLLLMGTPIGMGLVLFAFTRLGYIRQRVANFLDPTPDLAGIGYQTHQAKIAIGSGGLWGVGLGASQQKRLFLPDVHTDFIFALVGEELGLFGTLGVITLFLAFCYYGIRAAERARDDFGFLVGTGIVLTLGLQSILNMAVATASVPPKGIALPFVSYGGSQLIVAAAAAGILARIAADGREQTLVVADDDPSRVAGAMLTPSGLWERARNLFVSCS